MRRENADVEKDDGGADEAYGYREKDMCQDGEL